MSFLYASITGSGASETSTNESERRAAMRLLYHPVGFAGLQNGRIAASDGVPSVALSIGTRVGAYEIPGAIVAGGMGEVYRVRDTKLNRGVAIKALGPVWMRRLACVNR
jgi:hypothetical protein